MALTGRWAADARLRWRAPADPRVAVQRLATWPCPSGGAVRHMFPLAAVESRGADVLRVAECDGAWAACLVLPSDLVVPCGDPDVIAAAGWPHRRWRLLVGDAAAADALLDRWGGEPGLIVHVQRFMSVVPDRVPDPAAVPDPGLRPAVEADVDGLAELALQLHLDDGHGPHPGRAGMRAYRQRMVTGVRGGSVWCVGDPGDPLVKIERSVDSGRWGVQLAGICVRPDRRARGLGTRAVAEAVRQALADRGGGPVSLHVRADNAPAVEVYRRAGFVDREEWRLAVRTR